MRTDQELGALQSLQSPTISPLMKFPTISANALPVLLALIASIATASAETLPMSPKEHLETYDMPPAYIFRLETSPRMISRLGPFTSYQANVDAQGNNIVGDAANET